MNDVRTVLKQENEDLRKLNVELLAALESFANLPCLENFDDDQLVRHDITAGEIRRARAAIAKAKGES